MQSPATITNIDATRRNRDWLHTDWSQELEDGRAARIRKVIRCLVEAGFNLHSPRARGTQSAIAHHFKVSRQRVSQVLREEERR